MLFISMASFYRVMHVVHLSVTLSDQEHTCWKSWKLISRTISATHSLFLAHLKAIHLLPGEHGEIWGRLQVGWEKVACWSTKAAISLKRVKIEENWGLLWRAHRRSPTLFRTVPSRTPTASSSTRLGVRNPTQNCNAIV